MADVGITHDILLSSAHNTIITDLTANVDCLRYLFGCIKWNYAELRDVMSLCKLFRDLAHDNVRSIYGDEVDVGYSSFDKYKQLKHLCVECMDDSEDGIDKENPHKLLTCRMETPSFKDAAKYIDTENYEKLYFLTEGTEMEFMKSGELYLHCLEGADEDRVSDSDMKCFFNKFNLDKIKVVRVIGELNLSHVKDRPLKNLRRLILEDEFADISVYTKFSHVSEIELHVDNPMSAGLLMPSVKTLVVKYLNNDYGPSRFAAAKTKQLIDHFPNLEGLECRVNEGTTAKIIDDLLELEVPNIIIAVVSPARDDEHMLCDISNMSSALMLTKCLKLGKHSIEYLYYTKRHGYKKIVSREVMADAGSSETKMNDYVSKMLKLIKQRYHTFCKKMSVDKYRFLAESDATVHGYIALLECKEMTIDDIVTNFGKEDGTFYGNVGALLKLNQFATQSRADICDYEIRNCVNDEIIVERKLTVPSKLMDD